jgi:tRNA pseudouridine38-40 synthase
MRVKAVIAYDGSAFYGFQRQTTTPLTVTNTLEKALRSIHINAPVIGSGRTDRDVHATGQVIHFDIPDFWSDLHKLKQILNQKLDAVSIRSLQHVHNDFHARFDAKKRCYRYLFKTEVPSVFERNYLAHYQAGFDPHKLQEALTLFEGKHDFLYFHKTGSQPHTTVRTLYKSRYYQYGNIHVIIFEANGFLRSQVRMMVEGAMQYARGEWQKEAFLQQLHTVRQSMRKPAPAAGLYLAKIHY